MSQPRLGARLVAAALATLVPTSIGAMAPALGAPSRSDSPTATSHAVASSAATATVDLAAFTPSVTVLHESLTGLAPRVVAPRTTITGTLDLSSRAGRHRTISVSSAKGSHTWTASALAEHDLPSAAMRAYKTAARTISTQQPGCHLPWTLLAGIGCVESDHGRYGGSVLGDDGVPRPAIVGIALDGAGPVAAIHDTDGGRFDGDTVWDRAVGPMQFIPSTWRSAGRDGDGDGVRSPNDIDDAALAAAGYLCHGGRDLTDVASQRAAIFSYNPSDYYVDLVSAFAHGYRTGSFVIPSPPVAPGAGDGVVHLRPTPARAQRVTHRVHRVVTHRPRGHVATTPAPKPSPSSKPAPKPAPKPTPKPAPKPAPKPTPKPTPKPRPTPPPLLTASGPVTAAGGGWTIGGVTLQAGDLAPIAAKDYDGDGAVEALPDEFAGMAEKATPATLSYYDKPAFKVVGFSAS